MQNQEFNINIDNYSGPLDVLLDLAKAQKVDLANISITQLADQFIEFINRTKEINLELASEYLLMATWLAYLKSKLLLPEDDEDDFKASEVAEKLKLQLKVKKFDTGKNEISDNENGSNIGPVLNWNPQTGSLQLSQVATQKLLASLGGHVTQRRDTGLTVFFPIADTDNI